METTYITPELKLDPHYHGAFIEVVVIFDIICTLYSGLCTQVKLKLTKDDKCCAGHHLLFQEWPTTDHRGIVWYASKHQ